MNIVSFSPELNKQAQEITFSRQRQNDMTHKSVLTIYWEFI